MEKNKEGFTQASDKELKEIAFSKRMVLIKSKNDYMSNLINARYFLARYNMMAVQIQSKDIKENIDGCQKTEEFMMAEAMMMKKQALSAFREAHFGQLDLKKDFELTDQDIQDIEADSYDGKIIRESYDESYKKGSKADFVK